VSHTQTPWDVSTEQVPFLPKQNGGGMKVRIMGARSKATSYKGTEPREFALSLAQNCKSERICTLNVGLTPEIARANAAFIVRAVNAHEELLAALKNASRMLSAWGEDNEFPEWEADKERIRQAIAKAEGK